MTAVRESMFIVGWPLTYGASGETRVEWITTEESRHTDFKIPADRLGIEPLRFILHIRVCIESFFVMTHSFFGRVFR